MTFEDVTVYAGIAGLALIVVGALLLAFFPAWGGFRPQGAEEPESSLAKLIAALLQAFTSFLEIVKDMVTGRAGRYHPGQVLIAVGFLLLIVAAILYVISLLV